MTNILLAGIVSVGKSELIQQTQKIGLGLEQIVHNVSIGDVVKQSARNAGLNPERLLLTHHAIQRTLISGGIVEKSAMAALSAGDGAHLVIDTPLTLYTRHGILTQTIEDLDAFAVIGRRIDRVVVLIDDPRETAKRLAASNYTAKPEEVLTWTTAEIMRAYDFARRYTPGRLPIVMPRPSSRTSLIKALVDHDPAILYPIQPISAIIKLEKSESADDTALAHRLRREIAEFEEFVQNCAIITKPIEVMGYEPSEVEQEHTFFRDGIFVTQADILAGCYAGGYGSIGGDFEYTLGLLFAKPASMINERPVMHPFGHSRIPFRFNTTKEFRAAIISSDPKYAPLKCLLNSAGTDFRYSHIENIAKKVA